MSGAKNPFQLYALTSCLLHISGAVQWCMACKGLTFTMRSLSWFVRHAFCAARSQISARSASKACRRRSRTLLAASLQIFLNLSGLNCLPDSRRTGLLCWALQAALARLAIKSFSGHRLRHWFTHEACSQVHKSLSTVRHIAKTIHYRRGNGSRPASKESSSNAR